MIVNYLHNSISSLSNKPDTKWSIKTVHVRVTVCPQNAPLKQAGQESQNSDSSELLQQSMADIRQGWTSAMFTICNTLLADHTGPRYWLFCLLPSCYIKFFVHHSYPASCHCHSPLPFAISMCHLPFSFAVAIRPLGLLPFCYIRCFVCHAYPALCRCRLRCHFPLPFAICHLPFAVCHLPFAVCHLPFAICHLPFSIFHFPFSIFHFPFSIFHLLFAICHLPLPFAIILLSCWPIPTCTPAILLASSCHFATLNAIPRPACHTLACPEVSASGPSTRQTTVSHHCMARPASHRCLK